MKRKLVAALACRNTGSRLFGKPMQNITPGTSILDLILQAIDQMPQIDTPVLGISEGTDNTGFVDVARNADIPYIIGDETDVLWRLIMCGRVAAATDVFRITTECPFVAFEYLEEAWTRHVEDGNDITVTDYLPEGLAFEIYTLKALEVSHEKGDERDRTEICHSYARRQFKEFKIGLIEPEPAARRTDLRLTVDYPEDLVVCRKVFEHLKHQSPVLRAADIVSFLDDRPDLVSLLSPFVADEPIWAHTQV